MTDRQRYFAAILCWLAAWAILGFMESWWALIPAVMTVRTAWQWMNAVDKSRRR